jgi:hypothetical protein
LAGRQIPLMMRRGGHTDQVKCNPLPALEDG